MFKLSSFFSFFCKKRRQLEENSHDENEVVWDESGGIELFNGQPLGEPFFQGVLDMSDEEYNNLVKEREERLIRLAKEGHPEFKKHLPDSEFKS